MLPYEDDEQQQREWQYLLDPPRDMVHVIPLVGAVPTPVPGRAVRAPTTRLRVGAATLPRQPRPGQRPRRRSPRSSPPRRGRPATPAASASLGPPWIRIETSRPQPRPRRAAHRPPTTTTKKTARTTAPRAAPPAGRRGRRDDAGVLEQRGERGLQEAGGGESEAVAGRPDGGRPHGARAGPGTPAMIGGASRRWLHRRRQRRRRNPTRRRRRRRRRGPWNGEIREIPLLGLVYFACLPFGFFGFFFSCFSRPGAGGGLGLYFCS